MGENSTSISNTRDGKSGTRIGDTSRKSSYCIPLLKPIEHIYEMVRIFHSITSGLEFES